MGSGRSGNNASLRLSSASAARPGGGRVETPAKAAAGGGKPGLAGSRTVGPNTRRDSLSHTPSRPNSRSHQYSPPSKHWADAAPNRRKLGASPFAPNTGTPTPTHRLARRNPTSDGSAVQERRLPLSSGRTRYDLRPAPFETDCPTPCNRLWRGAPSRSENSFNRRRGVSAARASAQTLPPGAKSDPDGASRAIVQAARY